MTVEPYTAVGIVPQIRAIHRRSEISVNLDHLHGLCMYGGLLGGALGLPVKLIAIPEGALQGFTDEAEDMDHELYAETCAIDIPGKETDTLAEWAKELKVFIIAQAKARHPDFPKRFFNVGFVISPEGEIILLHYKLTTLYPIEHSMTPHDVFDMWVDKHGRTLDAFWPVVDTPIGRIGIMMANEASYPENARGLAMNGCEIAYRSAYPHPGTSSGMFEIQNRARALDNNMYVLAPNGGAYYMSVDAPNGIDAFAGQSMIVDYQGRITGEYRHGGNASVVLSTIDISALRHFRLNSPWANWAKDLRTEMYQLIYEKPVYPKNLYAAQKPFKHKEYKEKVTLPQIALMRSRGIWRE